MSRAEAGIRLRRKHLGCHHSNDGAGVKAQLCFASAGIHFNLTKAIKVATEHAQISTLTRVPANPPGRRKYLLFHSAATLLTASRSSMHELLACSAVRLLLPTLFLLRVCEFMACSLLSSARPLVAAGYDAWILPSHTIANPTRRGSAAVLHPGVLLSRFRFCCAALFLARYVYCVLYICVRCGLSTPYLASVCPCHGLVLTLRQVIGGVLVAAFFR